eukprot:3308412-Amphidinium_carterae.1
MVWLNGGVVIVDCCVNPLTRSRLGICGIHVSPLVGSLVTTFHVTSDCSGMGVPEVVFHQYAFRRGWFVKSLFASDTSKHCRAWLATICTHAHSLQLTVMERERERHVILMNAQAVIDSMATCCRLVLSAHSWTSLGVAYVTTLSQRMVLKDLKEVLAMVIRTPSAKQEAQDSGVEVIGIPGINVSHIALAVEKQSFRPSFRDNSAEVLQEFFVQALVAMQVIDVPKFRDFLSMHGYPVRA